jgi:hypothetical protein
MCYYSTQHRHRRPQQRKSARPLLETTITGIFYLDILQQFLTPQLDEDDQEGHIHFQQDGVPPPLP